MEYNTICHDCQKYGTAKQFIINIKPRNDGIYEVCCPNGHKYKIEIGNEYSL